MKRVSVAGAVTLCALGASAGFLDGGDLYEKMKIGDEGGNLYAMGFVVGAHDAAYKVSVCSPKSANAGEAYDLVKFSLETLPEVRRMDANQIVVTVLSAKWPCKKGSK